MTAYERAIVALTELGIKHQKMREANMRRPRTSGEIAYYSKMADASNGFSEEELFGSGLNESQNTSCEVI